MFTIQDSNIKLQRGDTASIRTVIYTCMDGIYEIQPEDKIYFKLYKHKTDYPNKRPILTKTFKDRTIIFNPEDTKFLLDGEFYYTCSIEMKDGNKETYLEGRFFLV